MVWRRHHLLNSNEACSQEYLLNGVCELSPPHSEVCSLCKSEILQVQHTLKLFCNLITGDKHYLHIDLGAGDGVCEYSARHLRNLNLGWRYLLIISPHTFLLCLIELETSSSPAELRPGSPHCVLGFAVGLLLPCNNSVILHPLPQEVGGELKSCPYHICNLGWSRLLFFSPSQALACKLTTNTAHWSTILKVPPLSVNCGLFLWIFISSYFSLADVSHRQSEQWDQVL